MKFKAIAILLSLSFCLSCELRANRADPAPTSTDITVFLKPIEAVIHPRSELVVAAKETQIAPAATSLAEPFLHAQFVNERTGWATTARALYKTSDTGSSWERLSFKPPESSRIASVFFIDESRGWLAITKQVATERYGLGNSSQIFATNDGGKTWKQQADFTREVRVREIKFVSENHGLAIGARVVDQPVTVGAPYEELLVLRTEDGGAMWTDVSDGIKNAVLNEGGQVSDSGRNIGWQSPTDALLLTTNGRVLYSSDRGKTWKSLAKFRHERTGGIVSSTTYYKIILDPEKKIRVIGGAMGDEGYWGDLIVADSNRAWITYELPRTPILDSVFLSSNEVLACGVELGGVEDKRELPAAGIVLHSLDGGKSWTLIYRSQAEERFISLTKVGGKQFFAVSDAGKFVKFSME